MRGVKNPIDEIQENIKHKFESKTINPHLMPDDGSNLNSPIHKNFEKIFNSMEKGHEVAHINLTAERDR